MPTKTSSSEVRITMKSVMRNSATETTGGVSLAGRTSTWQWKIPTTQDPCSIAMGQFTYRTYIFLTNTRSSWKVEGFPQVHPISFPQDWCLFSPSHNNHIKCHFKFQSLIISSVTGKRRTFFLQTRIWVGFLARGLVCKRCWIRLAVNRILNFGFRVELMFKTFGRLNVKQGH